MDPISLALITGAATGLATSGADHALEGVVSTYTALKQRIIAKFSPESRLARAIQDVEDEYDSVAYQAVLQEQVAKTKATEDQAILQAAQALLDEIQQQPDGAQHIQNVYGHHIAAAQHGNAYTYNYGPDTPPPASPRS